MRKVLHIVAAAAIFCVLVFGAQAQTIVTPINQPHQTFFDNSGNPCAICSLYSYTAGTTSPLPTYTDSTGSTQNTNPIVLDVAGGANIWLGTTYTYKFVLKNASGATVWTVDNVKSNSGAVPCISPYSVQFANSSGNALSCDSTITINPTSHALQVGGAISGPSFSLKNLNPIPTSWTFDITTPLSALNSLGAIPLANLASQAADTLLMNATGSASSPTAVPLPTGCTTGINYNTTSHTWSCLTASVSLSSIAEQGPDTVVMNATGGSASPTAVPLPSSCTDGVNYNTTTHTWSCITATARTCNAYGCYKIDADGTITQWGTITGCATPDNASCNVNVTFPTTFTTTANLSITTSVEGWTNCLANPNSPGPSGFTMSFASVIFVGGAGMHCPGTEIGTWRATGY